jgi:hypothetical protein
MPLDEQTTADMLLDHERRLQKLEGGDKAKQDETRLRELERRAGIPAPLEPFQPTTVDTCRDGKPHEYQSTIGRTRVDAPAPHCVRCGRTKNT